MIISMFEFKYGFCWRMEGAVKTPGRILPQEYTNSEVGEVEGTLPLESHSSFCHAIGVTYWWLLWVLRVSYTTTNQHNKQKQNRENRW